MDSPGQPQVFADRRDREARCAGRDECLVPVNREIRRKRDFAVVARFLEVELAIETAVKERRKESTIAFLERQPQGLEIPTVLPVPCRGQLSQGIADLISWQVAKRQDQLAANARIGVICD